MKKLLFVLAIAVSALKVSAQTPPTIPAKEAAKHINEKVRICDKIFGGKFLSSSDITLLDVGGYHPNESLTLLIKGDDRKKFKTAPEEAFKGKSVCITGTIIDYKGKPEIVITEVEQITEAM